MKDTLLKIFGAVLPYIPAFLLGNSVSKNKAKEKSNGLVEEARAAASANKLRK